MTSTKTILVVDDDATLRSGLQTMLQENGYRTLEADDGVQAIDMIGQHSPDLVILDMMMPRWGGFAVLEKFQGQATAPRFIMLTAHDGAKHKTYAKQIGVVDYLHKPCSMEHLLNRIELLFAEPTAPENREPDSIRVACFSCGARIKAPAQLLGQTRPCPRCRHPLVVRETPTDEGPILIPM